MEIMRQEKVMKVERRTMIALTRSEPPISFQGLVSSVDGS